MNAITEWRLPATEMFLRDNHGDSDFSAFMSVWFFEEQKHSLVLIEYLRRFRPDLMPTEEELHKVRFEFDPAPPLETLMLHFCGEIRLNPLVPLRRQLAYRAGDPGHLQDHFAGRGARHAGAYLQYNAPRAVRPRGKHPGAGAPGVLQDRHADGIGQPHAAGDASRPICM